MYGLKGFMYGLKGWIFPIIVLIILIAVIGVGIPQSQGWHYFKEETTSESWYFLNNNVTSTKASE